MPGREKALFSPEVKPVLSVSVFVVFGISANCRKTDKTFPCPSVEWFHPVKQATESCFYVQSEICRSMPGRKIILRWHELNLLNGLNHNVLQNSLSIEHAHNAVAVTGIVFGVRHHDDGSALFV